MNYTGAVFSSTKVDLEFEEDIEEWTLASNIGCWAFSPFRKMKDDMRLDKREERDERE